MIVTLLFDYRELQVLQVRLERLVLQVRRERRGTKENQVLRGGQGSKEARVPLDHLGKEETLGLLYVVKDATYVHSDCPSCQLLFALHYNYHMLL